MQAPHASEFRPVAIRAWRCTRHPEREAAARCPVCGQPFCRECVVEHEGRLLCSGCLAKARSGGGETRRARPALKRTLTLLASALFLWAGFFLLGEVLVRIPPSFHDATIWRERAVPAAKP